MLIPALLLATALPLTADSTVDGPFDYRTEQIAPNVWGFFEKRLNPVVSSNIIAVAGTRSVLVYDTGHHPPITRRIIADIQRLTHKPVQFVVVSHWHDDHWIGNAEFVSAYPSVRIIAHPFTARMLRTRESHIGGEECKEELRPGLEQMREQLAKGKRPDGSPISDSTRVRTQHFIEALAGHMADCDEMRYRGVDSVFTDSLNVDLGKQVVTLRFLGRGNTAGDVVAWLPASRTLLTGDLVVHPFPFATQSYITEWTRVLRSFDAFGARAIVPGHGPIMHDLGYVHVLMQVFDSVATMARKAYRPGMTNDQLHSAVDVKELADGFSNGDAFIRANFVAQMQSTVDRLWQELSGNWKEEGIGESS